MSKTETAWRTLDEHFEIKSRLANGEPVALSANDIKRVAKREPRLLTKFDTRSNRPNPIGNATILPVRNGKYLILPGDGYHKLEEVDKVMQWRVAAEALNLGTLPWDTGPTSESQLIDMVSASGLLAEFLDDQNQYLTVRGRLRSPDFSFMFPTIAGPKRVNVSGVQIEVDGGYEGTRINLVEAKLGKRDDFIVRQLYFPIRMWQERLPNKESRGVFLSYSDRLISLRLYHFEQVDSYGSITLEKAADYTFDPAEPSLSLVDALTQTRPEESPPGVTFPQADDMEKVLDIVDATATGVVSAEDTVDRYGFTSRQAHYYPTAARYLGLLSTQGTPRRLTALGREFVASPRPKRHEIVLRRLAALPVFSLKFQAFIASR